MRSSTLARALGILILAIVVGGLIGWWASRSSSPGPSNSAPAPAPEIVATVPPPEPPLAPAPIPKVSNEVRPQNNVVAANTNSFDPAEWDEKVDEILGDADDDTDRKARQLLDMMDKVNVEAQTEIAGHIVNLVDDKDFAERAAKYLTNADVPEEVSSVFMDDLYNRDEEMKLPLLLAVARNDKHPLRDEAKDLLELYLEEDYGSDWGKWESAMNKYLKEEAEANAADATQPTGQ